MSHVFRLGIELCTFKGSLQNNNIHIYSTTEYLFKLNKSVPNFGTWLKTHK